MSDRSIERIDVGVKRLSVLQNDGAPLLRAASCLLSCLQAYVYLKRFLYLALESIPKHKDFALKRYMKDRDWLIRVR